MDMENTTDFSNAEVDKNSMETPLYILLWVSACHGIIFFLGVFGNIMVILVVTIVPEMRTAINFFLLNLSIADLLVLLICQPAALIEFFAQDRWYLGKVICKLIPIMENGVLQVSILTILAVSSERYYAICYPLKMKIKWSRATAFKVIITIWVVSYTCTIPFTFMTQLEDALFYDKTPIKVCRIKVTEEWNYVYTTTLFIIFFVLPFFILVVMFSRMIRHLTSDTLSLLTRNDTNAMRAHRSRKQVVRMLVFIIILFFASLFPLRVVGLWVIFSPPGQVEKLGLEGYLNLMCFAQVMLYLNSAGNPIIYSLTSTKFKRAFKCILFPCFRAKRNNSCTLLRTFDTTFVNTTDPRKMPSLNARGLLSTRLSSSPRM